ncbi:MAG: hypothetical protein GY809_19330, partial [Planctomycetes bacterium]|nr:hypothetical protein [Planctomycetota bacterium]
MNWKHSMHRAAVTGLVVFAIPCAMAQIQPIASPAVNREIQGARPAVMDMRVAMQPPTGQMAAD